MVTNTYNHPSNGTPTGMNPVLFAAFKAATRAIDGEAIGDDIQLAEKYGLIEGDICTDGLCYEPSMAYGRIIE